MMAGSVNCPSSRSSAANAFSITLIMPDPVAFGRPTGSPADEARGAPRLGNPTCPANHVQRAWFGLAWLARHGPLSAIVTDCRVVCAETSDEPNANSLVSRAYRKLFEIIYISINKIFKYDQI